MNMDTMLDVYCRTNVVMHGSLIEHHLSGLGVFAARKFADGSLAWFY